MIVMISAIQPYVQGKYGFSPGISKFDWGPRFRSPALAAAFENVAINDIAINRIANDVIIGMM
jgi:hypothetical protein